MTDKIITESRHTLCHYGLQHVDAEGKAAYHMYSTFPASQARCICKPPIKFTSKAQATTTAKLFEQIAPKVLKESRVEHSRPFLVRDPDSNGILNVNENE